MLLNSENWRFFQKIILRNILFIIPEKGSLGDFLFIKKDVDFSEFSKEKVLQELEKLFCTLIIHS